MSLNCKVIEDLLPLYIDEVCSEQSIVLVEEHLQNCEVCRRKFDAQKTNISVDKDAIQSNLKSKAPFKKIKRQQLIKTLVILIIIPFVLLSIVEVRGDGIGFSALHGRYKTEKFLKLIEREEFSKAAEYSGFTGGIYQTIEGENKAKRVWISNMKSLGKDGIKIISHKDNSIRTDDGFTSGYITISIEYERDLYDFRIFVSTNNGKVEMGPISYDLQYPEQEPGDIEKVIIQKVSDVLNTYNPG